MKTYAASKSGSLVAGITLCLCSSLAFEKMMPPVNLSAAPVVITNKPVEIYFNRWPTNQWLTNEVKQTQWLGSTTAYGVTSDSNYTVIVTTRTPFKTPTNCLVTAFTGTDTIAAQNYQPRTNSATSIITNQGPVTFWLPPTNKYVISLWGMMADGGLHLSSQSIYPPNPSNQVRFVWNLLFSDRMEKPTHQWTQGDQTYSFTLTNGVNMGTNKFVRAVGTAVLDDFTPKAVALDQNTIQIIK